MIESMDDRSIYAVEVTSFNNILIEYRLNHLTMKTRTSLLKYTRYLNT